MKLAQDLIGKTIKFEAHNPYSFSGKALVRLKLTFLNDKYAIFYDKSNDSYILKQFEDFDAFVSDIRLRILSEEVECVLFRVEPCKFVVRSVLDSSLNSSEIIGKIITNSGKDFISVQSVYLASDKTLNNYRMLRYGDTVLFQNTTFPESTTLKDKLDLNDYRVFWNVSGLSRTEDQYLKIDPQQVVYDFATSDASKPLYFIGKVEI